MLSFSWPKPLVDLKLLIKKFPLKVVLQLIHTAKLQPET
jgi:hypothetical protein